MIADRPTVRNALLLQPVILAAALALPSLASAQTGQDELVRQRLLDEAETAYSRGDHTAALDAARRAAEIRATPSVLLMIAEEHNALGHPLDALGAVERCLRELRTHSHVAHRRRLLAAAMTLRNSLRARVGTVTLTLPQPTPAGLRVRIQGGEVVPALWGLPYPVTPGTITVEASTDTTTFRREVVVSAGQEAQLTVELTPIPTTPTTGTGTGDTAATNTSPLPGTTPVSTTQAVITPPPPPPPPPPSGPGAGPWILVGAGVAAAGTGLALYLAGVDLNSDLVNVTDYNAQVAQYDRAVAFIVSGDVLMAVGGAAVGGGLLWYFLARPRAESSPARASLRWGATPTRDGLVLNLGGTF